jgi:transcriptional repressor NrdR
MVIKKDGRREPFSTEKLGEGVRAAFHKRPVPTEMLDKLVDEVERELLRRGEREIAAKIVGRAVLKRIKKLDKVAWLRFASVYLEFEDLSDFEKMLERENV